MKTTPKQDYIKLIKEIKYLSKDCKKMILDLLENNEFTKEVENKINVLIKEDEALYLSNPHHTLGEHVSVTFSLLKDMIFKKK
jgi:hypothetical protein